MVFRIKYDQYVVLFQSIDKIDPSIPDIFGIDQIIGSLHNSSLSLFLNSQNATALAAATFRESTPWAMGIRTR